MTTYDADTVASLLDAGSEGTSAQALSTVLDLAARRFSCAWGAAIWAPEGMGESLALYGAGMPDGALEAARRACRAWCRDGVGPTILQTAETPDPAKGGMPSVLATGQVIPLQVGAAVRGCLVLGPVDRDLSEAADLVSVGQAAGAAVEMAALRGRLAQQERLTQTLYRVSQATTSAQDLDSLLSLIVRLVVDTIDEAENCVLHLLDESTGHLLPKALSFVEGRPIDREGRMHMRLGEGAAGQALQSAEVINIANVDSDPRFVRSEHGRVFGSMIVAPIVLGERRLGTLSADSPQRHAFSGDDERLLLMLASHAASAIGNARLLHDLQASLADLQSMQEQMIQVEKLSALGRMIAGVSHELNNPLTAVMGYAQLILMAETLETECRQDVERIYSQADRAAKIVRSLQMFARSETGARQLVDVNEIVDSVLELQAAQLRMEHIDLVRRLAPQPLGVFGDYYQLQQVFFHLVSNARDAMTAHRGAGCLTVTSARCGDVIEVRVEDDGGGMTADVRQHIFDPFFTTKSIGQGTGLGLSVVYGIVAGHSGRVYVEGSAGTGSVFVVHLPMAE